MATKATKLPSGSWRVRVECTGPDGKRRWKSFTAPTRKEAEFQAAQYAYTEREAHDPGKVTVGQAIDAYIDARTAVLSPSTIRGYRQIRRCYLLDIQPLRVRDLRPSDVQRAVNRLAQSVGPKTVRNAYAVLTAAIQTYRPDFRPDADLPRRVRTEIAIPEQSDVQRILDAAKGKPLEIAILLAAGYGLRRGEVCALTPGDLDPARCAISVTKSFACADGGKWVIKAPKSYAGTRTIPVSRAMMDKLVQLPGPYLVPLNPNSLTIAYNRLCSRLGISCRFHDLRHYNASGMLALNVPDKYAMERLGQSTPGLIKTVYQHIMDDKRRQVSAIVNDAFDQLIAPTT